MPPSEAEARRRAATAETEKPRLEIQEPTGMARVPSARGAEQPEPETAERNPFDTGQKLSPAEINILKGKYAAGASDAEFAVFIRVCERTALDPFTEQIRFLKRQKKERYRDGAGQWQEKWVDTFSIQVGIDGFRLIATRTGEYQGQTEPQWCGKDGVWRAVWVDSNAPVAARVGVYRKGFVAPLYAVAHFREYAQKSGDRLIRQWANMPTNQLAKCAEALALRKAFPQELAGLYTDDEMAQADNTKPPAATAAPSGETADAGVTVDTNGRTSEADETARPEDGAYRSTFTFPFGEQKNTEITSPYVSVGLLLGGIEWTKHESRRDDYALWLEAASAEILARVAIYTKDDMNTDSFERAVKWAHNQKRRDEFMWFTDAVRARIRQIENGVPEGEKRENPTPPPARAENSPTSSPTSQSDSDAGSTTD